MRLTPLISIGLSIFASLTLFAEPLAVTPVLYPVETSSSLVVGGAGRVEHVATLSNQFRNIVVSFPVAVVSPSSCHVAPGQSEEFDEASGLVRLVPRFQWDPIRNNQGKCAAGDGQRYLLRFSRNLNAFPPGTGQSEVKERFILGAGAEAPIIYEVRLHTNDGVINGASKVTLTKIGSGGLQD